MEDSRYRAILIAFALALVGAVASYCAAGAALGLLIGSIAFTALITPPLAIAVSQRSERVLIAIATAAGSVVVCMFCLSVVDSLQCALILLVFALALVALTHTLQSLRISASIAPALTTIVALAWLSFPIWFRSERAASLIAFHPIFAMNGTVKSLGIWTQQPILYRLTTLGQDVPFALPTSIWPCVILHGVIAMLLLAPVQIQARADDELSDRQTRPTPPPAPPESRTP